MFKDRQDAARQLAQQLQAYRGKNAVVAALARGAVPMGCHLALALEAELFLVVVRKIGAPGNPELAIGAISNTRNPQTWINQQLIRLLGISDRYVEDEIARQRLELKRRSQLYGADRRNPSLENRTVILTDDGIATGATMRIALTAVKQQRPARCVLAVPLAARETVADLSGEVDDLICLQQPDPFIAVGAHFEHFSQVDDDEVIRLLTQFDQLACERSEKAAVPAHKTNLPD